MYIVLFQNSLLFTDGFVLIGKNFPQLYRIIFLAFILVTQFHVDFYEITFHVLYYLSIPIYGSVKFLNLIFYENIRSDSWNFRQVQLQLAFFKFLVTGSFLTDLSLKMEYKQ